MRPPSTPLRPACLLVLPRASTTVISSPRLFHTPFPIRRRALRVSSCHAGVVRLVDEGGGAVREEEGRDEAAAEPRRGWEGEAAAAAGRWVGAPSRPCSRRPSSRSRSSASSTAPPSAPPSAPAATHVSLSSSGSRPKPSPPTWRSLPSRCATRGTRS